MAEVRNSRSSVRVAILTSTLSGPGVFAKVWNGSAFVSAQVRVWSGSAFVDPVAIKTWNGTAFV